MAAATSGSGKLLPVSQEGFRNREYWETFFQQRTSAFEWYGEWKDLRGAVLPCLAPATPDATAGVLVIGCGNSDLSAHMYDDGVTSITNLDFSPAVIAAMSKRNSARPGMSWVEADMMATGLPDASFDMVVDKGALDALAAEDTPTTRADAAKLFQEVLRQLRPGGVYAVVSLLQTHVLAALQEGMAGTAGLILPFQPLDSVSPLCPFLGLFRKGAASAPDAHTAVCLTAPMASGACPPEIKAWMEATAEPSSPEALAQGVKDVQWKYKSLGDLGRPSPGRIVLFEMGGEGAEDVPTTAAAAATAGPTPEPRFRVAVVDSAAKGKRCGVLLVPQGREAEWTFASDRGRRQLAQQQGFARLVYITLGRGHTFGEALAVQEELNPTMAQLALTGSKGNMPYLAVATDLGRREVLDRVPMEEGGEVMIVEEVWEDAGAPCPSARRMVFTSNQAAVQTEAALVPAPAGEVPAPGTLTVDHSALPFEFHSAMVGAMAFVSRPAITASTALAMARRSNPAATLPREEAFRVDIMGLGGGALPMFLAHHYPFMAVHTVELSPAVVEVATKWFGYTPSPSNTVAVGDGVEALTAPPSGPGAHVVLVDVDSKDPSSGQSFPPPAFLTKAVLTGAAARLAPGGILLINAASRTPEGFYDIVCKVEAVFTRTYMAMDDDGSINQVLIATNPKMAGGAPDDTTPLLAPHSALAAGKLMAKLASPALDASVDLLEWADSFRPVGSLGKRIGKAVAGGTVVMTAADVAPTKKKKKRGKRGGKRNKK